MSKTSIPAQEANIGHCLGNLWKSLPRNEICSTFYQDSLFLFLKTLHEGFSGGSMEKNPPADSGDVDSTPDLGRSHILRAAKPLYHKYGAFTRELREGSHSLLSAGTQSPCPATRAATATRSPSTPTGSKPPPSNWRRACTAMKTQHSQYINTII